ncbi:MAG TPA: hypothetical protein VHR66_09755 [Gemmataceae bacterium]|jgi:Spy/CpxP family protein refolding chaperone|nr:hypothetical protein [Gemmataceae bacterium]
MRFVPTLFLATALTALPASAFAGDADSRALYPVGSVYYFFDKERKAELKVTAEQEKALLDTKERREKVRLRYEDESRALLDSKTPEREKNAKLRVQETKASDELLRMYGEILRPEQIKRMKQILFQNREMEVFDHPEVRAALKIGDKEVRVLRDAYNQLGRETVEQLKAEVAAKKITNEEAARRARKIGWSVPDQVRALLTPDQQKVFNELYGEKYGFRK